ncbi:MAG: 5'-methylthioadenosine/S-adenosylhomocysteine nucleosidase [Anaerolineae bacterium]|nr:5'-methylthioadenosine/S-adenosylhomocysteine nucleosidase [Anaerolineae bacterium]
MAAIPPAAHPAPWDGAGEATRPGPVLIVGIRWELARLAARLADLRWQDRPWGRLGVGRWPGCGVDVALAAAGIGKVSAAMAAQAALEALRPRAVVSCGSAGGLAPELRVGDLVLGDPVIAHDQGVFLPLAMARRHPAHRSDGFLPIGSPLPRGRRRSFRADPALLTAAAAAARRAGLPSPHVGPLVTGDQVILQDAARQWLRTAFAALAVDNETAAVAQVAHCHGVPWLALRGVSDPASSDAAFDFTPFLRYQDDPARSAPGALGDFARRARLALVQPAAARRIQRFRQGARRAMDAVAALLDALLPALWPVTDR